MINALDRSSSRFFRITTQISDAIAQTGTSRLIATGLGDGQGEFQFFQLMPTLKKTGAWVLDLGNS